MDQSAIDAARSTAAWALDQLVSAAREWVTISTPFNSSNAASLPFEGDRAANVRREAAAISRIA
jgi:hypothetical protein